jgi:hypothetical protein
MFKDMHYNLVQMASNPHENNEEDLIKFMKNKLVCLCNVSFSECMCIPYEALKFIKKQVR